MRFRMFCQTTRAREPQRKYQRLSSGMTGMTRWMATTIATIQGSSYLILACQGARMTVCTLGHIACHSYLTDHKAEHVYEKHLVKRFLYFLIGGEQAFNDDDDPSLPPALPVTDCARLQAVLGSLSPDPNSPFRQETVAAQLGKAVSCYGTACPDTGSGRLSEFFLLRHEINGMKNRVRQAPLPTPNRIRI